VRLGLFNKSLPTHQVFRSRLLSVCLAVFTDPIPLPLASMSSPSPAYPSYQPVRNSQSFDPNAPPAPPPKPSGQEVSRRSTPAGSQPVVPPPPSQQQQQDQFGTRASDGLQHVQQARMGEAAYAQHSQDPGDQWLPRILEDKSSVTLLLSLPESN